MNWIDADCINKAKGDFFMKISLNTDGTYNIEGLSPKKMALLQRLIYAASREGGYRIDIDEYEEMVKAFNFLDIKSVFDLDKEKAEIEANVHEIMSKYK